MTLTEQFATMIAMTAMGGWIGASLTTYHRFIHPRKKWHLLMILTDILFWMVQGLFIFLVLLNVNDGQIRFYIFLALGLGFSAYKALLEKIFKRVLEALIHIVLTTTHFLTKFFNLFFVQPTIVLLKAFYKLGKMVGRITLAVLLFLLSAIFLPLKWIFHLLIPKAWIEKGQALIRKGKTLLSKAGNWFKWWK